MRTSRPSRCLLVGALAVAGCSAFTPTVLLPSDAPLTAAMCGGWPADPPLAFAGWATSAQLDTVLPLKSDRVFALVTRDAIDQPRLGGSGVVHARGLCLELPNGDIAVGTVPDDWTLEPDD